MVPYNLGLTLLSLYMFYEMTMSVYQGRYNFFCQNTHSGGEADSRGDALSSPGSKLRLQLHPVDFMLAHGELDARIAPLGRSVQLLSSLCSGCCYSFHLLHIEGGYSPSVNLPPFKGLMMNVLWWYYFSKLIEFMDTFFFILRKNNHQITVLHVYHHASMLNIWWFVLNWVPCGHSYFGATFNSFIHVLMYSYYGLSAVPALRPFLWWKKYITQGQLVQFVLTMFQTLCAVVWPCGFPMGWLYFQTSYMVTLILLFSNFYVQTYKRGGVSRKGAHSNGSLTGHSNGVTSSEKIKHRKPRTD
ncbi:hypothetical protein DNTS_033568 [Danionella cerebrum]|uniref:Elongation of very long chain fatty acids protein n=1 Tax=Danionella cerebrum TaxID=2873325 RepID=A0A553R446_9TELE|nr:hypothetical protein DNTS_033568 [Danionella translucida]